VKTRLLGRVSGVAILCSDIITWSVTKCKHHQQKTSVCFQTTNCLLDYTNRGGLFLK